MPLKLIHRLRALKRRTCKCKQLLDGSHREQRRKGDQFLPDALFHKILQYARPFDLCRWRRVNKATKEYVDSRISEIKGLKVEKKCLAEKIGLRSAHNQATTGYKCSEWQLHNTAQIAARIGDYSDHFKCLEIVVDQKWTSKDVDVLCQMMDAFRKLAVSAIVDAPIVEMVVVGVSQLDLSRWYAYLCMLKAFGGLIIRVNNAENREPKEEAYWPNLTQLTIRMTQNESEHLARILNYGVRSNHLIDRRVIEELRVEFTDAEKYTPNLVQNLYQFRCWLGSPGFGDRFRHFFGAEQFHKAC